MKNESFIMMLVLLGQLLMLRVVAGYPWWNPMPYNSPYYTGFPRPFPALDATQAKDKVGRKPAGFRPPVFPPSFYAPNMPLPYPNYYAGMLPPPYPAYPNPFNVNNRIDDGRNGRNGKRRDGEEKDERKQDDEPKSITIPPTYSAFIPGNYAPGYPYPSYYPAPQTQQQQYMYPGAYGQGNQYAYPQQQQQQEQQQLNDEPAKINPPPPPKIPQLMSTLVQLSKNKQKYGYLDDRPSCSSCTKCNQCYKSPICAQCGLCQSKLCDQAIASLPMIPKDVRPLWERWSERTADMNSMEMSGLIFESPKKWLKKLGVHIGGSKRSHINTHKKGDKKTLKKVTKKQS